MMKEQWWRLIKRDGSLVTGTDRFPSGKERENVKEFSVSYPFVEGLCSVVLPDGANLIYLRENEITAREGEIITKSHKYYIGYSLGDITALLEIAPIYLPVRRNALYRFWAKIRKKQYFEEMAVFRLVQSR